MSSRASAVMTQFAQRGGWWVVAQFVLFAFYIVALVGTEPLSQGYALDLAQVIGFSLTAAGIVMVGWSIILIGRHLTPYPAPMDGTVLVATGPYRLVRHPIYGGLIIAALGLALMALNPWALMFALVFVLFFMAKTGFEEDLLMERFRGYGEYRALVPRRLIPWLL
jgi:protein-S-isoprenylcysteine O-methyltransferase Ste14